MAKKKKKRPVSNDLASESKVGNDILEALADFIDAIKQGEVLSRLSITTQVELGRRLSEEAKQGRKEDEPHFKEPNQERKRRRRP